MKYIVRKQFRPIVQLALIAALFCCSSCGFKNKEADLIVHNARIYTVDEDFHIYEAMAIKDGIIVAIGPEREILNEYSAPKTIDAQKRPIYPGFIDAHCHFLAFGQTLREVDLVGTTSFAEVIDKVRSFYEEKKKNNELGALTHIMGRGWDQNDWTVQEFPDRAVLDSLFPDLPVILKRVDGHASLVNTAALRMAKIQPGQEIKGGEFQMRDGRLTGILLDNAMDYMDRFIPRPTAEQDKLALLEAQRKCFETGLTTVDDAGLLKKDIDLIKAMHASGELKMRIYAMLSDDSTNFAYYLKAGIDTSARLSVRAFKFYADGALGSRGACLLSPYSDVLPPVNHGFLRSDISHFRQSAYMLRKHGFQMCTHAIGDSANRVMLNIYAEVMSDSLFDHRWRIEHAQVVHQDDIGKFGMNHIIPSVQPTHATSDMPWAAERLGRNRVYRAYTYRELKEQLGMIALGTDCPVEGISTMATYYAAVARKDKDGKPEGGWQKENALSREDALRGMTIWAAMANFEDHHKGSLEVGKYADFVMLDRDIVESDESLLLQALVLKTALGGEIVYDRMLEQ